MPKTIDFPATDFSDFQRGHTAALIQMQSIFVGARDAGADALPMEEASVVLAPLVAKFLDDRPSGASSAELAGRYHGVLQVLAGLAFEGFLLVVQREAAQADGVH